MKVSVILPTYKRSEFLVRAIQSVYEQDYNDFEIIVIDDNGENTTDQKKNFEVLEAFIQKPNFKYFPLPTNSGACFARNKGAELSKSEILMFLDDDDYYLPNKISKQVAALKNPSVDACLCAMKRITETDFEIVSENNFPRGIDLKSYILEGNCFTAMIAIRKEVFLKIGGFSEIARYQDRFFMYKFYENNLKSEFIREQLFVLNEHNQERISLGNIDKVSQARKQLFEFQKKHFHLFTTKERKCLTNDYFFNLAKIRVSGNFIERMEGVFYLIKATTFFSNYKIFIKLFIPNFIPKKN